MGDSFKTAAAEQINLLMTKGVIISNIEDAHRYLMRRSFYDVMKFYAPFFLDNKGYFMQGTSFQEIAYVQLFDKEIRNILLKAIMEIQYSFQSLIGYFFTECHTENNAFLKNEHYDNSRTAEAAELITLLKDILNRMNKMKIKHSLNAEHYVLSSLLHELNFQQTIQLYSCLQKSDQLNLAKHYSKQLSKGLSEMTDVTPDQIISFLANLQELKDIIINNCTLLHYQCHENTAYSDKLHSFYNITQSDNRSDVYNCFITMSVFLTENQFALVNNSLRKRFKQLFRIIQTIDPNIITRTLGFPDDWHKALCLSKENQ